MKQVILLTGLFFFSFSHLAQTDCVDPNQIDPDAMCTQQWDPVCGCDGVTYGNDCEAFYWGGVTSWTPGECPPDGGDCMELGEVDFGLCEMVIGIGLIDGVCSTISGCGYVGADGVNYQDYFFESFDACQALCGGCIDTSVINPDFICDGGPDPVCGCDGVTYMNSCVAYYHYGVTEWTVGPCVCPDPAVMDPEIFCIALWDPVCGCDGNTYGNWCEAWYWGGITEWTPGECGDVECMDLGGIDFGDCDFPLGVAYINGQCQFISGCDWEVDGVDYEPYFFDSEEDCMAACPEQVECMELDSIDFGPCDAIIGVAWTSQGCMELSGCSQTSTDGVDYSAYFFNSMGECQMNCVSPECIDESMIDPEVECPQTAFVCGCDSVTYQSDCAATYWYGVTSFEEGVCEVPVECYNEMQVDSSVACPDLWAPVCGCDGVTYGNECEAFFYGGQQTWVEGECDTVSVFELSANPFIIYPNPASGSFQIRFERMPGGQLNIYNFMGEIVRRQEVESLISTVFIDDLASGVYLIEVLDYSGERRNVRLIKE